MSDGKTDAFRTAGDDGSLALQKVIHLVKSLSCRIP
jgi:hypothetical protein